jgi:hypothetical protein
MLLSLLRLYHRYLLGFLWICIQALLFYQHGVKIVFDSHRYLHHANEMAFHNNLIQDRNILYLGYTAVLALFFKLGFTVKGFIFFQIVASGIAAISLYKLADFISKNWLVAFLAVLFYIAWPDVQAWNFYIHTEALFTSGLLIYTNFLFRNRAAKRYLLLLPLLIWLLFLRPNGIIVGIATFIYLLAVLREYSSRLFKRAVVLLSLILLAVTPFIVNTLLHGIISLPATYKGGSLFGGHTFMALKSATPLYDPLPSDPAWKQLALFIWYNPIYFSKLFILKFIVFFAQIKPYYSLFHNATIILFIYPIYILAGKALVRSVINTPQRLFFLTLIFVQAAISAFTLPDWDNRFIVPVLPIIFLLAALGCGSRVRAYSASGKPEEAYA